MVLRCRPLLILLSTTLLTMTQAETTFAPPKAARSSITNTIPGQRNLSKPPSELNPAEGLTVTKCPDGTTSSSISAAAAPKQPLTVLRLTSFILMLSLALVMFSPASALIAQLDADRATSLLSMITAGAALVEITLSPVLGSVIDSVGRKPVMMTAISLLCLVNIIAATNSTSTVAICLAKFVGLLGMSWFFISNQAIISDIAASDPERLSATMGVQMALVGAGFFVGALAAGRLAEYGGLSLSYGTSAIVGAMAAFLVTFGMPETLPPAKRVPFHAPAARKMILQSPLSCIRLLFQHGRQVQTLAILLIFQTVPMFMGDLLQVFARQEWDLSTKEYSSFIALWSVTGICANTIGSFLVRTLGIKRFMGIATLSSMCAPIGATFFGFRGTVLGSIMGFLGAAQSMGINAALVSQARESGVPQGELAGERASLVAMLKVIGPILYSTLYVQGRGKLGLKQLPFVFNICLAASAFVVSQLYLPSLDDVKKETTTSS